MTRIALVIIVASLASAAVTATYFVPANPTSTKEVESKSDHEQRVRDFFKPAPKRDLHTGREMKPRW